MLHSILISLLMVMLAYGSLVRLMDMGETMARLSGGDKMREWLGYLFLIILCFLAIGAFWLTQAPSLGIVAFGAMVFYVHSARRQFPVF